MGRRNLHGLRVIITGASQGIGRALVTTAASKGLKIVATARSRTLLEELETEVHKTGGEIAIIAGDIARDEDRRAIVELAQQKWGGVDLLLNNAGIGATGHFMDSKPDTLRAIFETNYFGAVELTRLCIPLLKEAKTPAIVNISSVLGRRAWPARGLYSASKFALAGWSESIRAELIRFGIDVLVVSPGLTQTNFSHNMLEQSAKLPLDHLRGMTPESVAEATWNAIRRGRRETVLTPRGKLLVLVARIAPGLIDFFAKRTIRKLFRDEREAKLRAAKST